MGIQFRNLGKDIAIELDCNQRLDRCRKCEARKPEKLGCQTHRDTVVEQNKLIDNEEKGDELFDKIDRGRGIVSCSRGWTIKTTH